MKIELTGKPYAPPLRHITPGDLARRRAVHCANCFCTGEIQLLLHELQLCSESIGVFGCMGAGDWIFWRKFYENAGAVAGIQFRIAELFMEAIS